MLVCTGSKGVRHGDDGVVEVDGVRCMELMDNVCATAALTEQREKYMVLVEVVHFFCAAAAALLLVLRAHGRKEKGRGAGERVRERARVELESAAVLRTGCATRSLAVSVARRRVSRASAAFPRCAARSSKGRFEFE